MSSSCSSPCLQDEGFPYCFFNEHCQLFRFLCSTHGSPEVTSAGNLLFELDNPVMCVYHRMDRLMISCHSLDLGPRILEEFFVVICCAFRSLRSVMNEYVLVHLRVVFRWHRRT